MAPHTSSRIQVADRINRRTQPLHKINAALLLRRRRGHWTIRIQVQTGHRLSGHSKINNLANGRYCYTFARSSVFQQPKKTIEWDKSVLHTEVDVRKLKIMHTNCMKTCRCFDRQGMTIKESRLSGGFYMIRYRNRLENFYIFIMERKDHGSFVNEWKETIAIELFPTTLIVDNEIKL